MNTDWRHRAESRHGEDTDRWLEELLEEEPPSSDQIETQRRKNQLDSLRSFDPRLRLEEELTLELSGEAAQGGAIEVNESASLLRPLQEMVRESTPGEVDLEIFGVSAGSTILHLRPKEGRSHDAASELPIESSGSQADSAIRELLRLVSAIENGTELRRWTGKEKLFNSLEKFAEALEKLNLSADISWSAVDGTYRSSTLTRRGRGNLREVRRSEKHQQRAQVAGVITEIKLSRTTGQVKIKRSMKKTSPAIDINFKREQLTSLRLAVGSRATFIINKVFEIDQIGRVRNQVNEFVNLVSSPEPPES